MVELSGAPVSIFEDWPLLFCCQLLPHAEDISAPSVRTWAASVVQYLDSTFEESGGPWCLHIYEPLSAETGKLYSRARLIQLEVMSILKQKRRGLYRAHCDSSNSDAMLVQVVLVTASHGYVSASSPEERRLLSPALSSHFAGFVSVPDDSKPPSRAFKKLKEAIHVFDLRLDKNMTCADLGACPGGWTYVLAQAGCHVTAVDRSALDPSLMQNSRVTFVRGDAFTWTPNHCLDWMVCDVITSPDKTARLVEKWISQKLCKNLCFTVKFKGSPDFPTLAEIRKMLHNSCISYSGKQLTNNKNELTFVGRLPQ